MTRIVAGQAGGRRIAVPRTGTRPTSERVREALFARLEHYGMIEDARVLDLCAGSGALGLEAASRGAADVTLVDCARAATRGPGPPPSWRGPPEDRWTWCSSTHPTRWMRPA